MKRNVFISPLVAFMSLSLVGCTITSGAIDPSDYAYTVNEVNVYVEAGKVDRTVDIRYYYDAEEVPFIGVRQFIREFFNYNISYFSDGSYYQYSANRSSIISVDTSRDILSLYNIQDFDYNPQYPHVTSKTFLHALDVSNTTPKIKSINLANYGINAHGDVDDAYLPLTLLSDLVGGMSGYTIAYNGEAIYALDQNGLLNAAGETRNAQYYGDSFHAPMQNEKRSDFLIKYNYNILCLVFDNLRGYTSQLVMGDYNLVSLGLNGLLEEFYPQIKEYLLSTDTETYLYGLKLLFCGLSDGGHTGIIDKAYNMTTEEMMRCLKDEKEKYLVTGHNKGTTAKSLEAVVMAQAKADLTKGESKYYVEDVATKIAYIGFDSFDYDVTGWDAYYRGKGEIPVETDTYAYIRDCLIKAKESEMKTVVFDVTTNGGGTLGACVAIAALCNGGKANFTQMDTISSYRITMSLGIDVDLDGDVDQDDFDMASGFDFEYVCLTSCYSFSCANLLPSMLKDNGAIIAGQKSGGGSCAITIECTADGVTYVRSSFVSLCNAKGDNIDTGVDIDFSLYNEEGETGAECYANFYSFEAMADGLSKLKGE